jgi:hypothetical protein
LFALREVVWVILHMLTNFAGAAAYVDRILNGREGQPVEVRPRMLTSLNSEEAAASDETVAEALTYLLERSDTQEGQLALLIHAK